MADPATTTAAATAPPPVQPPQERQEKTQDPIMTIATPAAFADLLSGHAYVVVDFHAAWCGPCRIVAPVFAQLAAAHAAAGSIAFAKVDVDDVPEVASQYRVTNLPTFTLIRDGEAFHEVKGTNVARLRSEVEAMAREAKERGEEGNGVKKALEDEDW